MSDILVLMLPEEGHLLPSFKLAKGLRARAHRVRYLVPPRLEANVAAQGMETLPLPEEMWQTRTKERASKLDGSHIAGVGAANESIWGGRAAFMRRLEELRPDLLIVDSYLPSVALIAQRTGIASVFLNASLDITMSAILLEDVLPPEEFHSPPVVSCLMSTPQLVTCPREFEFNHEATDNRALYYIECAVDLDRETRPFDWSRMDESLPLVYCTLGSQAHLYPESREVLRAVVEALRSRPDLQLILSVGKHLDPAFLEAPPPNALVVNWAPQLEILRRAFVMITHGGMGTLKECILFGVPMIVFPMSREQPMGAARVVYHGLGVRGDMKRVTAEGLRAMIEKVERNPAYAERARAMGAKFREAEESERGVKIVEKILAVLERRRSARPPAPALAGAPPQHTRP